MKRRASASTVALLAVACGCESRQGAGVSSDLHGVDEEPTRVLQCDLPGYTDGGAVAGARVFYAVDSMTRTLRRHPSLAAYARLKEVTSCEEAAVYASAYNEFAAKNPNFEDVADPQAAVDASGNPQAGVLPRLKIANGAHDIWYDFASGAPSPVVEIVPMYWLANSSSAMFVDSSGHLLRAGRQKV